jgi:hypothetical protein
MTSAPAERGRASLTRLQAARRGWDKMIKRLAPVLPAAAAFALLFPASAAAAPARQQPPAPKPFAQCTASGRDAICDAGGTVNRPYSLWLHVRARPKQRVTGAWTVACSKGTASDDKSGTFAGKTVLIREMKMGYRHPRQCIASADAQLTGSGKSIHLWLTVGK